MSILDLKALQSLCDAATPGKWERLGPAVVCPKGNALMCDPAMVSGPPGRMADLDLAAACREAVPALIQEVAALRPLVEAVREWQEAAKAVAAHEYGHAYGLGGDPKGETLLSNQRRALEALSALALPEETTK